MESRGTPGCSSNPGSGVRKSARKNLHTQEERQQETRQASSKRKRNYTDDDMPTKKPNNGECTNSQLMAAQKMDELPNRADLQHVENELTRKMHLNGQKLDKKIHENTREIHGINQRLEQQAVAVTKLEQDLDKHKKYGASNTAEQMRNEAREEKYLRARRSLRIWPVSVKQDEQPEVCVRRFFIMCMKVPANLTREVNIESVRMAVRGKENNRITDEYIVTFREAEDRDAIKSYASGLADSQGLAGLRLELPEFLKGSSRILEEHGFAVRQLYGKETKRNIKFDDRNRDLMIDIKLPGSTKWHNVTVEQAKRTKRLREESEVARLAQGRSMAGPAEDAERAKVLTLIHSPQRQAVTVATGANLIDIKNSFRDSANNEGGEEDAGAEGAQEETGDESDESMNRLLHGRKANNPYR